MKEWKEWKGKECSFCGEELYPLYGIDWDRARCKDCGVESWGRFLAMVRLSFLKPRRIGDIDRWRFAKKGVLVILGEEEV